VLLAGTTGMGVSGRRIAGGLGVVVGAGVGAAVVGRAAGMKVLTGRGGGATGASGVGSDFVASRLPRFSLTKPSTPMTS